MQKQRLIILVSGIILAFMAVFMIKVYLDQQRQTLKEEIEKNIQVDRENQSAVLVAKKEIPRGAIIDQDSIGQQIIPNQFVQPQAVTSMDRIAGMMAVAPISVGEQIILTKLSHPRQAGGLAEVTPVGKRAVTITVDNISSLVGMIKPGDYVDVILLINIPVKASDGKQMGDTKVIPLFQNVLVLAVGQETGAPVPGDTSRYKQEGQQKEISPLITLALGPQEANLMAYVQEQGRIRLILRAPTDSKIELMPPTGWETLFQYVMPTSFSSESSQSDKENKAEPERGAYVEIYRGINKEKVPLLE